MLVYMATLLSIRHNSRIKAHYERLIQQPDRPMVKTQAFGARGKGVAGGDRNRAAG